MADNVIKVYGAKQIEVELREMGKKAAGDYLKTALRAGAVPIHSQAKSNISPHSKTGKLEKAIYISKGTASRGKATVRVSISKAGFKGKPYGNWVEEGHFLGKRITGHFRGKNAKADYHKASVDAGRKFVEGVHFLEHAYDSKHSEAEAIIVDKLESLVK